MKRDIFNHLNEKIGEIELPDDTPDEVISKKLAMHAKVPEINFPDISASKLRQAIFLSGINLELIYTAIDSQEEPLKTLARIAWEYETVFKRSSETVDLIGASIGLSHDDVDNIWNLASTL